MKRIVLITVVVLLASCGTAGDPEKDAQAVCGYREKSNQSASKEGFMKCMSIRFEFMKKYSEGQKDPETFGETFESCSKEIWGKNPNK